MKHILSILLFACITTIYAQTNISGGVFINQTWTKVNSPYIVTGNTTIFPGVTLTIEPGVVVKFNNNIDFIVRGTLNINGAANDSTLITAATIDAVNPNQSWLGITVDIGQGGKVSAQYLIFEYSKNGFIAYLGSSNNMIYNFIYSSFRNNNMTISSNGEDGNETCSITYCNFYNNQNSTSELQNAIIDHCLFKGGQMAVHSNVTTRLTNCELSDLDMAFYLFGGTVDNCYIHHCAVGAALLPNQSITNSRFEYNQIAFKGVYPINFTTSIHDNIICGNTIGVKGFNAYPFSMANNCWCLAVGDIPSVIYDAYDDVSLGIITFEPVLTGCTITPPRVVTPVTTSILSSSTNTKTLQVFPNPTTQTLYFDQAINSGTITIYTSDSKIVTQQKMTTSQINVSELPAGYYIVSIQTENENYHSTFIKQ